MNGMFQIEYKWKRIVLKRIIKESPSVVMFLPLHCSNNNQSMQTRLSWVNNGISTKLLFYYKKNKIVESKLSRFLNTSIVMDNFQIYYWYWIEFHRLRPLLAESFGNNLRFSWQYSASYRVHSVKWVNDHSDLIYSWHDGSKLHLFPFVNYACYTSRQLPPKNNIFFRNKLLIEMDLIECVLKTTIHLLCFTVWRRNDSDWASSSEWLSSIIVRPLQKCINLFKYEKTLKTHMFTFLRETWIFGKSGGGEKISSKWRQISSWKDDSCFYWSLFWRFSWVGSFWWS